MLSIYRDLAWLERPPATFRSSLRDLASSVDDEPCGGEIQRLASFGLNLSELMLLGRVIRRRSAEQLRPLTPFRLGLLGNGRLDLLVEPLCAAAARHGLALEITLGAYGQTLQEALLASSTINAARPDVVLLALDWRGLPLRTCPGATEEAEQVVQECLAYINRLREGITANSGAVCVLTTFAPPPEALLAHLDRRLPGTSRYILDAVNRHISANVAAGPHVMLDVAMLAETVGLAAWFNPVLWNSAEFPFASEWLPLYVDHVARILASLRGKSRRVLVMDLDNTLWDGVAGDDGLERLVAAGGHLAMQHLALSLRQRGVVLAVCSKNDDHTARAVFEHHPDMLLKLEHLAVLQANWVDKATNIKAIASELNLGLESLVFLDDNPVERGLVRTLLPDVAVPELGDDPAFFSRLVAAAGYFESTTFSIDDRNRPELYAANARRVAVKNQAHDIDDYLASLQMEVSFAQFDESSRGRVTQLINKSNQFNLTARRYTEREIQMLADDPSVFTLQVRVTDMFGDNGTVSVVICRNREAHVWEIDTWLMSCRVLGRGVERFVLEEVLRQARRNSIEALLGVYRPTPRNALVAELYATLGFEELERTLDGETLWRLGLSGEASEAVACGVHDRAGC